jgi:hypothetical protein
MHQEPNSTEVRVAHNFKLRMLSYILISETIIPKLPDAEPRGRYNKIQYQIIPNTLIQTNLPFSVFLLPMFNFLRENRSANN